MAGVLCISEGRADVRALYFEVSILIIYTKNLKTRKFYLKIELYCVIIIIRGRCFNYAATRWRFNCPRIYPFTSARPSLVHNTPDGYLNNFVEKSSSITVKNFFGNKTKTTKKQHWKKVKTKKSLHCN